MSNSLLAEKWQMIVVHLANFWAELKFQTFSLLEWQVVVVVHLQPPSWGRFHFSTCHFNVSHTHSLCTFFGKTNYTCNSKWFATWSKDGGMGSMDIMRHQPHRIVLVFVWLPMKSMNRLLLELSKAEYLSGWYEAWCGEETIVSSNSFCGFWGLPLSALWKLPASLAQIAWETSIGCHSWCHSLLDVRSKVTFPTWLFRQLGWFHCCRVKIPI